MVQTSLRARSTSIRTGRWESGGLGRRLLLPALARPGLYRGRTPTLHATLRSSAPARRERHGAPARQRYASDIPGGVLGLNWQAAVRQGLARSPRLVGDGPSAACAALRGARDAARGRAPPRGRLLSGGWRDGSLFVPVRLLARPPPYEPWRSHAGRYWNLVMPYALASGLFRPAARVAHGVLAYMLAHGGGCSGLVRGAAFAPTGEPRVPDLGVQPGLRAERRPLSRRRGRGGPARPQPLRHARGRHDAGTFVAGEGESVSPFAGRLYRTMYQPPNGGPTLLPRRRCGLNAGRREPRRATERPAGLRAGIRDTRASWLRPGARRSSCGAHRPASARLVSLVARSDTISATARRTLRGRLRRR